MVAYCCYVIFPLVGVVVLSVGLALYFNEANEQVEPVLDYFISGGVFLGLALLAELSFRLFKSKAAVSKKSEGFPDKRNIVLRVLVTAYSVFFTVFIAWPLGYIIHLVVYVIVTPLLPEVWALTILGWVWRTFANLFAMWLSPFWNIRVIHKPKGGIPSGTIVMANHLTFSDAFILSSAVFPAECKYVATSWVFDLPFGGWMSKRSGDLPIAFKRVDPATNDGKKFITDKEVVKKTMKRAGEYLNMGLRMCVFPEGSLSKDGQLGEFKDGFFKLAIETKCSITPVGQWGAQTLWLHGENLPQPGYAEVAIGEAIQVLEDDTVESLKNRVRNAVLELRNGLPLYQKTRERTMTTAGKTSSWALNVPPNFV